MKHHSARFFASAAANFPGQTILAFALAAALFRPLAARAVDTQNEGEAFLLSETLRLCEQLKNAPDWKARLFAFNHMVELGMNHKSSPTAPRDGIHRLAGNDDPRAREALVQALIAALAAENRRIYAPRPSGNRTPLSNDEGELHADLIWALADLQDPRSTDVLLDAVNTGNVAVSSLATFGDKSLPKVMERLNAKPDRETNLSLMLVILQMCEDRNLSHVSPESKATIRQVLLAALNDHDPMIRKAGCKGLALFGDPATIPDLNRIASKDPETSTKRKHITYPIRDEAKDAIETIRAKQPVPKPEEKAKSSG